MSTLTVVVLFVAGVFLTWVFLVNVRIGFKQRQIDGAAALMFASVLLPSSATAVGILTGTYVIESDWVTGRVVSLVGIGRSVLEMASPALLAISAVVLAARVVSRRAELNLPLLGAAALSAGVALIHPDSSVGGVLTHLGVLVAASLVAAGRGARLGVGLGVVWVAGMSGYSAPLVPEAAFSPCSEASCSLIGLQRIRRDRLGLSEWKSSVLRYVTGGINSGRKFAGMTLQRLKRAT